MGDRRSMSREDERYGISRTIKRSRLFFVVPVIIIIIVSVNLVWEVIRANLGSHTLTSWPFRFTIIDASTTATVLAVFISLFMGRLQWARTLRPTAGVDIDDEDRRFLPTSDKWRIWVWNVGPGAATMESIAYYVRFIDQPEGEGVTNWVSLPVLNDQLQSRALKDGRDYFVRWYGHGAAFPVVQQNSQGLQLAWFTVEALAKLRILDIRIRYVDSLGDLHEKIVPIMHRLPSVAITGIKDYRANVPAGPRPLQNYSRRGASSEPT
jgi:hypothetical protein